MVNALKDKVCVVTGAGRGIGRAIVEAFAAEGADLVVNDVDEAAASETVAFAEKAGSRAVAHTDPIGPVSSAESLIATALENFNRVDVLVNNAGILRDRMLHNMSEDDWDQVIEVHLKGTWACGRAVVQHWRPIAKQEAADGTPAVRKIINVTSSSGLIGSVGQSNYSAAKMGIVGLTKTWAKELGGLGITVNAIAPTALTAMTEPLMQDPEAATKRLARFALGRYGAPEEIAQSFLFLASEASNYITGQVLCVDGGLVI